MKKKILAISLVVSLVAVAALGVTLAYFTDTKAVDNTFTMGNVSIDLTEPHFPGGTGGGTIPNVAPGDIIPKDPIIKNTGANDAWVFMKLTLSDAAALGTLLPTAEGAVTSGIINFDLSATSPWQVLDNELGTGDTRVIWIGYKTTIAHDAVTVAPFTQISLPGTWSSTQMATFDGSLSLKVDAYAIQADNLATLALAYAQVNP